MVALWGLVLFVPFLGAVHLFDWDEVNFAESAREMLLTKEYFRVQINFKPFWEKPPLFFWLQTLSYQLFGINEFAARFPNAICGILVLSTCYYLAQKHFSSKMASLWVLFITASFTPHLYYKSGIIDPWFNYFIFLSIYQLYQAASSPQHRYTNFALMGLFNGLAVLTKGPVALLVLGLCGFVLWAFKRFKPFFNVWHLLLTLFIITGITSIWFMSELVKNGPTVLTDFIAYQIDLFVNPVAGHGQPWYYHPVVLFFGCFPASIFALKAFTLQQKSASPEQLLFKQLMSIMFWVVLILFSMVKTKIVHYSSLCYLPLTFLAAYYCSDLLKQHQKMPWFKALLVLFIGLILSTALVLLPIVEHIKPLIIPLIKDPFAVASLAVKADWNGMEWTLGCLFGIIVLIFFIQQYRGNTVAALYSLLIAYSILLPAYIWQVAPKIEQYSQGPAIKFYKTLQHQDAYIETYGFKSYAQYFYPLQRQHTNPKHTNKDWLFAGEVDKEVYIVAKSTAENDCKKLPVVELGRKGGFIFYKRVPLPVLGKDTTLVP